MNENLVLSYVVAGTVIQEDGKYLLVQESQPKAYGLWNLPAGRAEQGDTLEQTAIRETKEESGYDVELQGKLGIFQDAPTVPAKHAFLATIVGGELHYPEDEIMAAGWFTLAEIKQMKDKLRDPWVLEAIQLAEEKDKALRPKVGVGVILLKGNKLLLGKRKSEHGNDSYSSGGGHMENLESFQEAVARELREETGLEAVNLRFLCLINLKKYAPKHYIDIGFVAEWKEGEPQTVEPDKFESWDWYDLDNLPEPLFEAIPYYLEAYRTGKNFFDA